MSRCGNDTSSTDSSFWTGVRPKSSYPLLLALVGWIWGSCAVGLISSNDGSHLALTRSLALRHEAALGDEAPLTLRVDLARRDGTLYSDRPPGTAMLAAPAVWFGAKLDPLLGARSRAERRVSQAPAGPDFAHTYRVRAPKARLLLDLQGSSILASVHVGCLGLLTLVLLGLRLRAVRTSEAIIAFSVAALGLASLLGPYAITLFGHVPAAFAVSLVYWSGERFEASRIADRGPRVRAGFIFGLAAGLAVVTDYLLVVPVAAFTVARLRRDLLAPYLGGMIVFGSGAAVYHTLAFGAPWAIGYDFHTNFEFAKSRATTFSGDIFGGFMMLAGFDDGGVGSMSPLWFLGFVAFFWTKDSDVPRWKRWIERAGWCLWILALAKHRTPMGGAFHDHRYLIPILPVLAFDLGCLMSRITGERVRRMWTLIPVLAIASVIGTWSYVFEMRRIPLLTGSVTMWVLALAGALLGLLLVARRGDGPTVRKIPSDSEA